MSTATASARNAASPPPAPAARGLRMRTYLLVVFLLVSVVPIIVLAVASATRDARRNEAEARGRVREAAVSIQQEVEQYLVDNRSAIVVLAHLVEESKPDAATRFSIVARHRATYPGFYTMLVADANGVAVAADDGNQTGRKLVAQKTSVADREYFRQARDTNAPYISDTFMGRGFGADPIVAISAPIHDAQGRFAGIVEGSLDLRRLQLFEQRYQALAGVEIVLLDGKDQVIYASSRTGMKLLEVRSGTSMLKAAAAASDPASFYYDKTEGGHPIGYLASQQPLAVTHWRVFVRQPIEVLRGTTRRYYLLTLAWTLVTISICFLLAGFLARWITRPLAALATSVRDFQLSGEPAPITRAAGAPREIGELVDGVEEMQTRIGRSLQGLLPICSSCKKIRDEQGQWNQIESYIRSRSEADFTHGICPECARRLYPDDYKK